MKTTVKVAALHVSRTTLNVASQQIKYFIIIIGIMPSKYTLSGVESVELVWPPSVCLAACDDQHI